MSYIVKARSIVQKFIIQVMCHISNYSNTKNRIPSKLCLFQYDNDIFSLFTADLRSMHYDNVGDRSARSPPPRESPRFRAPGSPKDDLIKPPPVQQNANRESTYARGGHGIFGQPRVIIYTL